MVVCLPVAIVRLVLFGIAIVVGYAATKVALQGWKDKENPMPLWRRRIMWITRICSRVILFAFGYQWIKRKGRPVSREVAPIVVSNHVSYVEPIFYFYELFPTMVSSESHDSIPFVGTIIRAMQVIYVDRFSARSRKHAVHEIKRKASCNEFPRVLLFPEGTTTNGRVLISFQHGAFIPGLNIQPVVVRYPYVHFDQSWGDISLMKLMIRMFSQFHNFMEVEYLPVISPPASKLDAVSHFSEETSYAIASALNVVQTRHSYADVLMLTKASQLKKEKSSAYMVEMAWVGRSFNISTMEALEFLDCFLSMNPHSNGRVSLQEFAASFMLGSSPVAEKIFKYLDVEKKGSITFRQFLVGSAHIMKQPSFRTTCEAMFDALSDNGHDSISLHKLREVLHTVSTATERKATELFYQFDVDKDGTVNRNDFMTFMRKNPLLVALFVIQHKAGSEDIV